MWRLGRILGKIGGFGETQGMPKEAEEITIKITNAKLEKYNISISQKDAFLEYGSDTGMSIEISGYFVGTIYTARNISKCEIHLAIHEPELLEWLIGNNYDDREHEIVFHGRISYIDKTKFKVNISCEVTS